MQQSTVQLHCVCILCAVIAKFHYTGPTGPDRTRTDFVGDPHGPNGVSRRPGVLFTKVRTHRFVPYLCQLVFAAILWVKLLLMFLTVIPLKYALLTS